MITYVVLPTFLLKNVTFSPLLCKTNVNLPPPIDETFYLLAAASKSISVVPKAETRPTKFHDWVWFRPEAGPSSKKATGLYYIDAQSRHIPVGNKL